MNAGIARVIIDSNLPQLDKDFEYEVPTDLIGTIAIGSEVSVPFGRGKAPTLGYVTGLSNTPEYQGKLASIAEIKSGLPVLQPQTLTLLKALATRQACSTFDLIKLAIPTRAATAEKAETRPATPCVSSAARGLRRSILANPNASNGSNGPRLARELVQADGSASASTLVIVPDERAMRYFAQEFTESKIAFVRYDSGLTRVQRYAAFLRVAREPVVVLGTRSAAYLPIHNLKTVLMWDDGDDSYVEPTAPYLHTREVVLQRQALEQFDLVFAGYAVSTDVQRLVEIGHADADDSRCTKPRVASSDDLARVDSLSYRAVRESLNSGKPVLVQVATRGASSSVFCRQCRIRVQCRQCNGPVWVNERQQLCCRWCNALQLDATCKQCGKVDLVHGRAGATRTAAEFGRMFPGVQVIEATGADAIYQIEAKPAIVIATPGAEPTVTGGYGAVVLLDATNLLTRDSLRATEAAVRNWANAIALLAVDGRATIAGISGELATGISLWKLRELASRELADRRALGFPPANRLASIVGTKALVTELAAELAGSDLEVLGPLEIHDYKQRIADESRLLVKYSYGATKDLAARLRAFQLGSANAAKPATTRSGRAIRPLRIRMDEVEVI